MPIARKIRTFSDLPASEKFAFLEASILLAIARIVVDFVPLSKWRKQVAIKTYQPCEAEQLGKPQREQARMVLRTIKRVGRNVPVKFVCLPQALTARWMLSRRNIPTELFLGTRREAEVNREFHAWLMAGDIMVTGNCDPEDYAILGSQKRD
ncbi:hypothetical protein GCM10023115_23530 [Pontixanthobacter gangjinensis]|uniref:Lasso peptide biosynthesis B2 protein n=1 Tax=Pontixanthobacter gangjinensis TaxID=1028742 RepID=A0A6I4SQF3_9SPHN|nr:lasso peptide biosynthesis B2 protein [Pontixanthobacter gangjinensis]MXO57598.1 lasso peptide biosynthesis B2 protein [Pontixanthobacter gangjinensis]